MASESICIPPAKVEVRALNELALKGIVPMFSPESQLFCERLRRTESGLCRERISRRYTLISCLGLQRSHDAGLGSPLDARAIVRALMADPGWIGDLGDLGLLLWSCALTSPDDLNWLYASAGVANAMERLHEARHGRTMQLAWFLTGLSHAARAVPHLAARFKRQAFEAYALLKQNQGERGYFGHLAAGRSFTGVLRGKVGSFADQVYPIYGLSRFGTIYGVPEAIERARRCAEAICRVQGPLGQWWWHYDAASGRVVERYPVFSVHQDGMAPMALFAAGEAASVDFSGPVYKGLQWIAGNNELSFDFRDASASVIWRSVYHGDQWKLCLRRAARAAGFNGGEESTADLTIRHECRPYHLGWLLYAFAGHNAPGHLAPRQGVHLSK